MNTFIRVIFLILLYSGLARVQVMGQPSQHVYPQDAVDLINQNTISVEAQSANGVEETQITVINHHGTELLVDFSSTGFVPDNSQSPGPQQRVGVSYVKGYQPGTYLLRVPPGRSTTFFVSRCLDKSKPGPRTGTRLYPMKAKLPYYISDSLKQGASQEEIWQAIRPHQREWNDRYPKDISLSGIIKIIRGMPVPSDVKDKLDNFGTAAEILEGIFRRR